MLRSSTTTSYGLARSWSVSSPLDASDTTAPGSPSTRMIFMPLRTTGWSSTSRMRYMLGDATPGGDPARECCRTDTDGRIRPRPTSQDHDACHARPVRVLVVEDSAPVRARIVALLRDAGLDVVGE